MPARRPAPKEGTGPVSKPAMARVRASKQAFSSGVCVCAALLGCGSYPAPGFFASRSLAQAAVLASFAEEAAGTCKGPVSFRFGGDSDMVIETLPPIHEMGWLIERCDQQEARILDCAYHDDRGDRCHAHDTMPPSAKKGISTAGRLLGTAIEAANRKRCAREHPELEPQTGVTPLSAFVLVLKEPIRPGASEAWLTLVKCDEETPLHVVCEAEPSQICNVVP